MMDRDHWKLSKISKEKTAQICLYYAKSNATMGEVADVLDVGRNIVAISILRCLYYELIPKEFIDMALSKEIKNARSATSKNSIDEKASVLEELKDKKKSLLKKKNDCLLIRKKIGSTTLYKEKISSIDESLEEIERKAIKIMS